MMPLAAGRGAGPGFMVWQADCTQARIHGRPQPPLPPSAERERVRQPSLLFVVTHADGSGLRGYTDGRREQFAAPIATLSRPPPVAPPPSRPGGLPRAAPARISSPSPAPAVKPFAREASLLESRDAKVSPARQALISSWLKRDGFATLRIGGAIVSQVDGVSGIMAGEVTAGAVCAELDAIREAGARSLLVVVNSRGGSVAEGLGIVRALRRFSAEVGPVIAWVSGRAHSMAASIATAADFCLVDAWGGSFFLHHVHGGEPAARALLDARLSTHLEARTLVDEVTLGGWLDAELTLDAHQAVAHGFADELGDESRARALARDVARAGGLTANAPRTFRQQVLSQRRSEARR